MINKNSVQWLAQAIGRTIPTVLLILGAATFSIGIGMIYLPAGVITTGALAMMAGVLLIKGGGDGA